MAPFEANISAGLSLFSHALQMSKGLHHRFNNFTKKFIFNY